MLNLCLLPGSSRRATSRRYYDYTEHKGTDLLSATAATTAGDSRVKVTWTSTSSVATRRLHLRECGRQKAKLEQSIGEKNGHRPPFCLRQKEEFLVEDRMIGWRNDSELLVTS